MTCLISAPRMAFVLSLIATPVLADVTADQVWQNWQDLGGRMGYHFEPAEVVRDGATMTLRDLAFSATDGTTEITGTIPQVVLVEQGDGTVSVDIADDYEMMVISKDMAEQPSTARIIVTLTGDELTASGTPEAMNYAFLAESAAFAVRDLTDGESPMDVVLDGRVEAIDFRYDLVPGDNINLDVTVAMQSFTFGGSGTPNDDEMKSFEFDSKLTGLTGMTKYVLPGSVMTENTDPLVFFQEGGSVDTTLNYEGGEISATFITPDDVETSMTGSTMGGRFNIAFSLGKLNYLVEAQALSTSVTGLRVPEMGGIPLPELKVSYDEAGIDLRIPLAPGEEAQDFTMNTWQKGLTLSDTIWRMFDPLSKLPREPMTVVLDVTGKLRPIMNMFDPETFEGKEAPIEIDQVDLNALQVTAAGAELLGDGNVTFDNSQPKVLGDFLPMPIGVLNLSLTGADALMGTLLEMGLIDQEAVAGFGMMSAIFARPGDEPDTLVSTIEWKADGMYANDMLIPMGP